MKTIRIIVVVVCIAVSQFLSLPPVQAKPLSVGCQGLNGMARQQLEPGTSFGLAQDQAFQLGEVLNVTVALENATKGKFVIVGHDQKPVIGAIAVPGMVNYPILQSGNIDLTFQSIQSDTDGSITISIRCLPGIPVAVQAEGNQFAAGSSALVNNLNGKPLQLFSSPDEDAKVVINLPGNTLAKFTLEPLLIRKTVWYRVRANQIEGWTPAKVTVDSNELDSLVPYSDQLLDQIIASLTGKTDPASLFMAANVHFSKNEYDQALASLAELFKQDPNSAQAYSLQGTIYLMRQRFEDALNDLNHAIKLSADDAVLYELRALAYAKLKNYDGALADLDHAIQLNPQFTTAYETRASVLLNTKTWIQAGVDITRTAYFDPLFAYAYFDQSVVYFKQEDTSNAISMINRAIKFEPTSSTFFDFRGVIYATVGTYDRALADFKQAIALDPNNAQAYFDLGSLYEALDKIDAAIDSYTKVTELEKPDSGCLICAYMRLGQIYFSQGNSDKAIESFTHVIQLDPNYAEAYIERARAYVLKGDTAAAQADAEKAQELQNSGKATSY